MDSAIYAIVCISNGRRYVGSALSFKIRKRIHLSDLRLNRHHSPHLQRAWNKYGPEAFRFDILEYVNDPSRLIEREQHYIDTLNPEFNGCPRAASTLGFKHSPDSLAKMRAWKRKVPGPMKGRKQTPEARARMSKAKKGHTYKLGTTHAEESRRKMSASQQRRTQHNSRPVDQLAQNGTVVATFRSIADAARETGAHPGSIRHVLDGRSRLAAGYGWRNSGSVVPTSDDARSTRADYPWHQRPDRKQGIMLPGLRPIRQRKGLSQRDLYEQMGIRVPKISSYEIGRMGATPRTIMRLASALGVGPRDLVDLRTVPPTSSLVPHLSPAADSMSPTRHFSADRTHIAASVLRRRRRLGLSREDLAQRAGIALTTIADLEECLRKTYPSTLRKVAAALGCGVEALTTAPPASNSLT